MALLLSRLGKAKSVRSSFLILSKGFSSSFILTPPCAILDADLCGEGLGNLVINYANRLECNTLKKKVPFELVNNDTNGAMVTIGASHGWVATLKDEMLCLQDDLNLVASDTYQKRIPLPPLVTLPHCQTQIITNVSMSSSSPEDQSCLVAVKFLGPQLSICRPSQCKPEWVSIRIQHPCFFSSRVMFSKKDNVFRIPGSGGHLIASWDFHKHIHHKPEFQRLRFQKLPELTETKRELLDSCCTTEHLVESEPTGETFLVKWYKKTSETNNGIVKMRTEAVMVFNLDEQGNAVYTKDIGDLCIFLSKCEPFCVRASSFPGMRPNYVLVSDVDEITYVDVAGEIPTSGHYGKVPAPFIIPPQILV